VLAGRVRAMGVLGWFVAEAGSFIVEMMPAAA
jgi:hypothetical protein